MGKYTIDTWKILDTEIFQDFKDIIKPQKSTYIFMVIGIFGLYAPWITSNEARLLPFRIILKQDTYDLQACPELALLLSTFYWMGH